VLLKDYYSILGVTPSASKSEIQRAFRRLALEHHPDVNKKPGAESRFQEINSAYQVLKDPSRRAEYDASRETRPVPTRKSASGGQSDVRRYYFQRRVRAATDPGSTWNYYDVLGVPRNATEETIARAFQRLYGEFYAGRSVDPAAEAILREILEARDVLTDPERRVAYDRLPPDRQPPGSPRQQRSGDGRRQSPGRRQTGTGRRSTARFTVAVGVSILGLALGALIVLAL
jgi:curved DNA-binding protein CbpA